MNRSKKLYTLLGVLAVSCIAAFAVMRMEEQKEQIKNSDEIILELSDESVQSLSWEYNGETLSFHKDETWLYDEDENFPVSGERIHELLEQFQSFGAAFIIEDVEDFGQYGLDTPVCTINLSTAEQTYEIKLGDYSKMDSQRYVSIGDGNVYLVRHDPLDEYDAVLSDMIDHDEIPSFDHVTQIQFEGAEAYSITYQEHSADTYSDDVYFTRQNGRNLPLDTSRVDGYLQTMTDLNLVDYVTYHVTDEELQAYGLDAPEWTITVDYTREGDDGGEVSDTFVLSVNPDPEEAKAAGEAEDDGQETEISAYIRVGESQIIYKIPSGSYKMLSEASYNDLRHPEVIWADFSDVRQIDVSLEGNSYTLTSGKDKEERTWSYEDREDLESAGLQSALEALTAEEFTEELPAQKEEIGLTIYLDNENFPQVQIKLYRYDGSRCLAVVDGESVSLVERTAVVDLVEAVHAIVLD